jgi:hypothetical protein
VDQEDTKLKYIKVPGYQGWALLNDQKHGKGVEFGTDGARYEGDFVCGKRQGEGTLTDRENNIYKGHFHDNKINGKGRWEWNDGRVYDGEMKDN